MRVLSFANLKGGVGKTTSSVAFATILQKKGYKTLLIDANPQCDSSILYSADLDEKPSLNNVILVKGYGKVSIQDAIQHTEIGDIVAGSQELYLADAMLNDLAKFKNAVSELNDYDFVIVDTSNVSNSLVYNIFNAADDVILTVTADTDAIRLTYDIKDMIDEVKERTGSKLNLEGILLCNAASNTNLDKSAPDTLAAVAKSMNTKYFNTKIRNCVKVRESKTVKMPLIEYAPKCTAALDYVAVVNEYLSDIENHGGMEN